MSHDIVEAFDKVGLGLCRNVVEMLDEHFSHHTERRGCGYTQATRYIAPAINALRDPIQAADLALFASWPVAETEAFAARLVDSGWADGWRRLDSADEASTRIVGSANLQHQLRTLRPRLESIRASLASEESRLFAGLVCDILGGGGSGGEAPALPSMREKPSVGSCCQAEEFFLEIAQTRVRRGGQVNTVVDDDERPLMLEKVGIGESHSALVVNPIHINGVWIPPGALCALRYVDPMPVPRVTKNGFRLSTRSIAEVRFLRLTTLAVAPESRPRAFGVQLDAQVRANMLSPLTCTIQQLRDVAGKQLSDDRP